MLQAFAGHQSDSWRSARRLCGALLLRAAPDTPRHGLGLRAGPLAQICHRAFRELCAGLALLSPGGVGTLAPFLRCRGRYSIWSLLMLQARLLQTGFRLFAVGSPMHILALRPEMPQPLPSAHAPVRAERKQERESDRGECG